VVESCVAEYAGGCVAAKSKQVGFRAVSSLQRPCKNWWVHWPRNNK
jgi:hypothetical protein